MDSPWKKSTSLQKSRQIHGDMQIDPTIGTKSHNGPLFTMPSLQHLSQTADLEIDDPNYSNKFAMDTGYLILDKDDNPNVNSATSNTPLEENTVSSLRSPSSLDYKRNSQVTKELVYHIHLHNILSRHCQVDLNLGEEINKL